MKYYRIFWARKPIKESQIYAGITALHKLTRPNDSSPWTETEIGNFCFFMNSNNKKFLYWYEQTCPAVLQEVAESKLVMFGII